MSERVKPEQIYPRPKKENWNGNFGPVAHIEGVLFPERYVDDDKGGIGVDRDDGLHLMIIGESDNDLFLGRIRLGDLKSGDQIPNDAWVLSAKNVHKIEVNRLATEVIFSLEGVSWMKDWNSAGEELSLDKAQLTVNGKGRVKLMSKALESVSEF